MGATVLSVSSRAMLEACARLGLEPARLLAAAQLDRATVEDPDARIPLDRVATLWREAYEVSGDPNLALHAIEVLPFGAYRVVDLLSASAPTIGASITKVSNYFPLINDVVRLPIAIRRLRAVGRERRRGRLGQPHVRPLHPVRRRCRDLVAGARAPEPR